MIKVDVLVPYIALNQKWSSAKDEANGDYIVFVKKNSSLYSVVIFIVIVLIFYLTLADTSGLNAHWPIFWKICFIGIKLMIGTWLLHTKDRQQYPSNIHIWYSFNWKKQFFLYILILIEYHKFKSLFAWSFLHNRLWPGTNYLHDKAFRQTCNCELYIIINFNTILVRINYKINSLIGKDKTKLSLN